MSILEFLLFEKNYCEESDTVLYHQEYKYQNNMETDFVTSMLRIYTLGAIETFGTDVIVVLNGGEPGEYENNPTILEYEKKGYRLCDANMFGKDLEHYEALTFCKKKTK